MLGIVKKQRAASLVTPRLTKRMLVDTADLAFRDMLRDQARHRCGLDDVRIFAMQTNRPDQW
jgi:hypothetical protein